MRKVAAHGQRLGAALELEVGLVAQSAHHAGDGYASAEMALWDPRAEGGPRLVAWASQQMFFTKIT